MTEKVTQFPILLETLIEGDPSFKPTGTTGFAKEFRGDIYSSRGRFGNGTAYVDIGATEMKTNNFVSGSTGWRIQYNGDVEFNEGVFRGSLTATSISLGTSPLWFRVDINGNLWSGSADFTEAQSNTFAVTNAGALYCTSATISGATITTPTITSIQAGSEIAIQEWQHDLVFSSTDADTVAWASGTITLMDGTTYSIDAGNTGNIAASTYIYLDVGTSITVLQTTTTAATAVGSGKILVAFAKNSTSEALFKVFSGDAASRIIGTDLEDLSLTHDQIAANTIRASEITANTITATEIAATTITASEIAANTITANEITANTITASEIAATTITASEISTGLYVQIDSNLPSDEDLVGYWNFDEGIDSVANDASGNGHTGTLTNMEAADWVAGMVGTCLDFDGVDEYVSCGDIAATEGDVDLSIFVWAKGIQSGTAFGLVAKSTGGTRSWALQKNSVTNLRSRIYFAEGGNTEVNYTVPNDDEWHFYGFTYDKTTGYHRLYFDGVEVDSDNTPTGTIKDTATSVYIGRTYTGGTNYSWDGLIDEPKIYNAVISAEEAYALYKNPAGNKGLTIPIGRLTAGTIYSKQITLAITAGTGDSFIRGGASFDMANWRGEDCFILGLDDSDSDKAKFFIGDYSSTKYLKYVQGGDLEMYGGVIAGGSMAIGTGNTIFKADANGIYLGNATFASAPFSVNMAGALIASNVRITGGLVAPLVIIKEKTAGLQITGFWPMYEAQDGEVYQCDADDITKTNFFGMTMESVADAATVGLQIAGESLVASITTSATVGENLDHTTAEGIDQWDVFDANGETAYQGFITGDNVGNVTKIGIWCKEINVSAFNFAADLQIFPVDTDGKKTGSLIASVQISSSDVGLGGDWVDLELVSPISLKPRTQYVLNLSNFAKSGTGSFNWYKTDGVGTKQGLKYYSETGGGNYQIND